MRPARPRGPWLAAAAGLFFLLLAGSLAYLAWKRLGSLGSGGFPPGALLFALFGALLLIGLFLALGRAQRRRDREPPQ